MLDLSKATSIVTPKGSLAKITNSSGLTIWMKAPSYDPAFANNTWEQIIAACQANEVPDTWKVGHQKSMTINGVNRRIDIIGKKHDPYWNSGIAPLTFQVHDLLSTEKYTMYDSSDSSSGWAGSKMRKPYLGLFMGGMPASVRQAIKTVKKDTNIGNGVYSIQYTPDTLFLLSEIEVSGEGTYTSSIEGKQYEYYKSTGTAAMMKHDENSESQIWWLRSPCYDKDDGFCCITTSGTVGRKRFDTSQCIAPAFCF